MHTEMGTLAEFLHYFERVRARTEKLIPLIPHDDFEWRSGPGALSFGDLLRHMAGVERWMWAENVSGRPSRYEGHGEHLAMGPDAVGHYMQSLHAQSMEIIRALTPDSYAAQVSTPAGATLPAWKWLRAMAEHEAHHRGQLYLMLRMRGVATPPLFGLTAEQVSAASSGEAG